VEAIGVGVAGWSVGVADMFAAAGGGPQAITPAMSQSAGRLTTVRLTPNFERALAISRCRRR